MGLLSKDKFKYKFMFAGGVRRICLGPGTFICNLYKLGDH